MDEDFLEIVQDTDAVNKLVEVIKSKQEGIEPDKVDDAEAVTLAHDIVKKIEAELEYPGQIKATIIRETRVVDYAK